MTAVPDANAVETAVTYDEPQPEQTQPYRSVRVMTGLLGGSSILS